MENKGDGKKKVPLIGLLAVKNLLITKEELQKAMATCALAKDPEIALKDYLLSNELISSQNIERLQKAAKAFIIRQQELKFGNIAIRKGFVNQSVITLALEEQGQDIKDRRKVRMLGDILVEAGFLTPKQRNYILKLQNRARMDIKSMGEPDQDGSAGNPPKPSDADVEDNPPPDGESDADSEQEKMKEAEPAEEPGLMEPETIDGGVSLQITKDYMQAYITKTDYFDENLTTSQLKDILLDKGVVMGIVEDKMIEGFLKSSGFKEKPFLVARGIHPIQGKDAKIEFFFNTDYLKAGGVTSDGSIDFKDRGKVPHVEEGTVLAEKIPLVESRKGHSIFGDEIETIPGMDVDLKYGKGAKLSEDGFKVLAAVKGFPKYTLAGQIYVHQEYVTEGDVDYETGHINYDGNVTIKGRIKAGFKVIGNDVQALELDGGEIDAQGNVRIIGGINEGKIYSRGNVYAKFIHKSEIVCMGDVIVEKEIVDSDIESSGACMAENGKLISSRVAAKMGIRAKSIGTEMAEPCMLKVAYDVFLEKELETNKNQIENLKKQIEGEITKKDELKQENLDLQQQITDLAHVQDRSQLEEREILSSIESLEQAGDDPQQVGELKLKVDQLKLDAKEAEEKLDACFDQSEKIEARVEEIDEIIDGLEQQSDHLIEEKNNLIEWGNDNPGKAEVVVTGVIMTQTVIRGKHSEKRIREEIRYARIFEALCSVEEGKTINIYEFQVGNI